MAYLGRISAVLTANTRDFTRQIGTARRELQGFANQARGIQLNLDNRALNGTLTDLQRFRRTLQEIDRLQAAGVGAGLPNTRRLNDQFRAFEDLGRPITDLKNKIGGLSNAIQAELYPELQKVQGGFQNLYRDIGNGVTTFDQSAKRIENITNRLIGLNRAVAAASDFGSLTRQLNAGNTGASFFAPRAQEALQQSLALRGQAQGLPSRFREGQFADLAVRAEENAERIERAAARVASAQAQIDQYGETPNSLGRRSRAQAELDAATRKQRGINLEFQREIASAQIQQIVSPEAPRQADTLIERVRSLASELRAIDRNQFNGLIASTAAVVDQFNRGETSANRARAAVDRLAQSLEAAGRVQAGRQIGADLQEQADRLLFTDRERRQRTIQSAFDTAVANVPAGDPRRRRAELERDITLRRDQLVSEAIPRTQGLAGQARESGDQQAIRDAERLLQINKQINAELTRGANLANNNNYDESEASLRRVNALLERQQRLEADIADRVDVSNAARRQAELFLEQSGGVGEQLSQGARDAASDISVARQFRGQIASGSARIQIQQEIDRITTSVTALQKEIARVAASDLGVDEKSAELDRLDNQIRRSTRGLAQFVADRSGGAFGQAQIEASMQRARNTAGSISTRGFASGQLALQQGLFAIDDLISSTGGLEYKLRAVGNNITQLGLLLGQSGLVSGLSATTGLFIGLAAVIGTQAVLAISRFVFKTDEGQASVKAMSDAIASQRSKVKELSDAYKSLANSIADSGMSEAGRRVSDRSRERLARERQASDIALGEFASRSPQLALARGRERLAQQRLESAESLAGAASAARGQRQASAARQREERAASARIERLANSSSIEDIRRQRSQTRSDIASERARRSRASAAAVFTAGISTFFPGFETNRNRENRLRERLATQEGAIALGRQRQAESFVQRGQRIGDRLAPFQENVRGFTETQGRIDRILTRFAETAQKVADGSLSPGEIGAATNQLERLAAEAERVAISLQGLQGVLDRQVSQLADAFVSDLQNREEQLRRQANAAEARNDPAAAGLRRDEQDIIQARRRAEQQRQNIEEQISSERQRFEQELIAGRGNAEDRRRAEEIRAQREIIDSEKASQAEKERARLRLSQLELEQSQSFEQRASVQRLRDQANQGDIAAQREIQRIESRQRGRDLGLTELEQRRRELRQQAADIGEAFRSGDIGPGGVQAAARNMGGQLAPMLAQFRDEVLSARLQGPSRAALRVADINTAEGRSELNRLIRGEDSNRDVNLLELQNQSRLLEEIKVAIESETNMVVDL